MGSLKRPSKEPCRQNTSENPRKSWKTIENHRKTFGRLARTEGDPGGPILMGEGVTVKHHVFRPETPFSYLKKSLLKQEFLQLAMLAFVNIDIYLFD